jgi:hypothetical protein
MSRSNSLVTNLESPNNRFSLIEEDPETEKMANLGLIQLLAHAPPGSVALGSIEKLGHIFCAKLEIRSDFRNFVCKSGGVSQRLAVKRVIQKMDDKIFNWRRNKNPTSDLVLPSERRVS